MSAVEVREVLGPCSMLGTMNHGEVFDWSLIGQKSFFTYVYHKFTAKKRFFMEKIQFLRKNNIPSPAHRSRQEVTGPRPPGRDEKVVIQMTQQ